VSQGLYYRFAPAVRGFERRFKQVLGQFAVPKSVPDAEQHQVYIKSVLIL
jgi:hypothetical protein